MPDLSFYPEHVLVNSAFVNPVQFGRDNKDAIASMVDIADLSLLSIADAKDGINAALNSEMPWERYWGLIVCSSFGQEASEFVPAAKAIAQNDGELLNRTRAAEFLALIGAADPRPVIMDALAKTKDGVEALLILNTVVLLRDGEAGYPFSVPTEAITEEAWENRNVQSRLMYLQGRKTRCSWSNLKDCFRDGAIPLRLR